MKVELLWLVVFGQRIWPLRKTRAFKLCGARKAPTISKFPSRCVCTHILDIPYHSQCYQLSHPASQQRWQCKGHEMITFARTMHCQDGETLMWRFQHPDGRSLQVPLGQTSRSGGGVGPGMIDNYCTTQVGLTNMLVRTPCPLFGDC